MKITFSRATGFLAKLTSRGTAWCHVISCAWADGSLISTANPLDGCRLNTQLKLPFTITKHALPVTSYLLHGNPKMTLSLNE
jgi:hypothetical protein